MVKPKILALAISVAVTIVVMTAVWLRPISTHNHEDGSLHLVFEALKTSPAYIRLQQHCVKARFFLDSEDDEYVIFGIGEDFPKRWLRLATLRLSKESRTIEVSKLTDNGELVWVSDE